MHARYYDTWKIQMVALFIKCDLWGCVSDDIHCKSGNENPAIEWATNDLKAKSKIIWAIGSSEVKHIRVAVPQEKCG